MKVLPIPSFTLSSFVLSKIAQTIFIFFLRFSRYQLEVSPSLLSLLFPSLSQGEAQKRSLNSEVSSVLSLSAPAVRRCCSLSWPCLQSCCCSPSPHSHSASPNTCHLYWRSSTTLNTQNGPTILLPLCYEALDFFKHHHCYFAIKLQYFSLLPWFHEI